MKPNDRVIVDDGRQRFWVTIKKIVGDKIRAIDDRINKTIELPRSSIIASRRIARQERIAQRQAATRAMTVGELSRKLSVINQMSIVHLNGRPIKTVEVRNEIVNLTN